MGIKQNPFLYLFFDFRILSKIKTNPNYMKSILYTLFFSTFFLISNSISAQNDSLNLPFFWCGRIESKWLFRNLLYL